MTFLSGWRLILLLAPIALLVGYLLVQRRRHTQVLRFTSVDLLDSVAPQRSGWQRHLPAVGVLASLVALTIAFAQPAMALRTPVDRATILLALDTSGSMTADDVDPTRLDAAKDRARAFVDSLPDGVQVGIVTFNSNARLVVAPSQDRARCCRGSTASRPGARPRPPRASAPPSRRSRVCRAARTARPHRLRSSS